jgi:hypothetical protein
LTGDVRAVQRRLRASQGRFVPKPRLPVLDELVATVLSQHTSDTNSGRAFAQLKAGFSGWEQVADAPVEQVADAIRCGGIADQKARRIHRILAAIEAREGSLDLACLDDLDDLAAFDPILLIVGPVVHTSRKLSVSWFNSCDRLSVRQLLLDRLAPNPVVWTFFRNRKVVRGRGVDDGRRK